MVVRKTSAAVYHRIKADGLLSRRRLQVYEALYCRGPMTASECLESLRGDGFGRGLIPQTRARLTELRELGVVEELGERGCKVTGRNVILWDVTDRLPSRRGQAKRITRKELEARYTNLYECSDAVMSLLERRWPQWKRMLDSHDAAEFTFALNKLENVLLTGLRSDVLRPALPPGTPSGTGGTT